MPLTGTGPAWGTTIANDLLNANTNSSKLSSVERALVISTWQKICSDNVVAIVTNALGVQPNDSNGDAEGPVLIT